MNRRLRRADSNISTCAYGRQERLIRQLYLDDEICLLGVWSKFGGVTHESKATARSETS